MRKYSHWIVFGAAIIAWASYSQAETFESQIKRLSAVENDPLESFAQGSIVRGQTTADFASFENPSGCTGGAACDSCQNSCDCECIGNWRDNTMLWVGGDSYKSIGDMGLAPFNPAPLALGNSFGTVGGFNTGFGLGESPIRAQLGASYGAYDIKGRSIGPNTKSLEQQTFVTFGFSKRSDVGNGDRISWGMVYDQFFGHQWGWGENSVYLSQVRGVLGYALNESNEIGVIGTFHTHNDIAFFTPAGPVAPAVGPVGIRAMNQANTYWRHNWDFGGETTAYLGALDKADVASWLVGLLGTAPLSHNVSLYANATYVAPSSATGLVGAAEEQWNVSMGLIYYLGGKAQSSTVSGQSGLPLMPVANNGNFLITN